MQRRTFLRTATAAGGVAVAGCLGDERDELEGRVDELETQLEERNQTLDAVRAERDELEGRLADKHDELDGMELRVDDKSEEIFELDAKLREKRSELLELERETAEATAELETEIDELERRIEQLEPERTLSDEEIDAAVEVGLEMREAVVRVFTQRSGAAGYHVGDGVYVTVDHLFDGADDTGTVSLSPFDDRWEKATPAESDREMDVRVLNSSHATDSTVDVTDRANVDPGDVVVSVGHPINVGRWVMSVGRLDREEGSGDDRRLLLDAPTQLGNSGSAVFDLDGAFVGMAIQAIELDDVHDRPEEPFTHYHGYDPGGRAVPTALLADQLDAWGY